MKEFKVGSKIIILNPMYEFECGKVQTIIHIIDNTITTDLIVDTKVITLRLDHNSLNGNNFFDIGSTYANECITLAEYRKQKLLKIYDNTLQK